jgi:manganese/zinc/iron transport system substrate-binding protein
MFSVLAKFGLIAAALVVVGCSAPDKSETSTTGPLRVVSTLGMIDDAVREIGGDLVQAQALMGPGIDPHLYRPTPRDVAALEKAQLCLYGGLQLEGRMNEVLAKLKVLTVAVLEAVPEAERLYPEGAAGKPDPHVWFDVPAWRRVVERIRDAMIEARPADREAFTANADRFLAELEALDQEVRQELAQVPEARRVLITAHDAFGYFGRRYGFEVQGIQGMSTASEASAAEIRRLAALIAEKRIPAIFVESSVPPATIRALQNAVKSRGFQVKIGGELFSDAMGNPGTPEGTYVGMVRHNARTIAEALR